MLSSSPRPEVWETGVELKLPRLLRLASFHSAFAPQVLPGLPSFSLRVQVANGHIPTQNLYYNNYYPNPKYLIIGYMDPLGLKEPQTLNPCCLLVLDRVQPKSETLSPKSGVPDRVDSGDSDLVSSLGALNPKPSTQKL